MWYKEWIDTIKSRLIVLVLLFGLLDVFLLFMFADDHYRIKTTAASVFWAWFISSTMILIVAGVVFNADMVSREIDQNTLSFILTRPLSRATIYHHKLLINIAVVLSIFSLASLPILVRVGLANQDLELSQELALTALSLSIGTLACCMGAIVSVMKQWSNPVKKRKIGLLFVTILIFAYCVSIFSDREQLWQSLEELASKNILILALIGLGLAALLYRAGQAIFEMIEV